MSHKSNASDNYIGAMHCNDVINIKAKCKTLISASLDERILVESRRQKTLELMLITVQEGNDKLFLAVDQGIGNHKDNIIVIINPKMTKKAKQWIASKHPKLEFKEAKEYKSLINEEQCKIDNKHNEDLREFLRPTLENEEAKQNKVFGKSMKSYAQALGIKQRSEERKMNGN